MLTAEDIAIKVGIGRSSIVRKPFLSKYLVSEMSFGGRPKKYYADDVLLEFGLSVPSDSQAIEKITIDTKKITSKGYEMEEVERKRARNSSAGRNRLISEELERKLLTQTLKIYLGQSRRDNILRSTEYAVETLWHLISKECDKPIEDFTFYFYNKRLMRKDNRFTGYAHSENWLAEWDKEHSKNKFNSSMPTNRWDYISLFEDAGYVGQGFGAGLIWSIDGTQFDSWVDDGGSPKALSYLTILDGVTAMPLYMEYLDKGETIEATAKILWKAVKLHGKPKFGIVLDNGSAFLSKEIRALVKSWYTPQELEEMANNPLRKRMFYGQVEPCLYPLAKIPRYAIKAQHERWNELFNRFMYEYLSASYIGTRDSRAVYHELGSNPTQAVNNRPRREDAFAGFLNWIFTKELHRSQSKLNFLKKKGYKPNMIDLWQYFGGEVRDFTMRLSEDFGEKIAVCGANYDLPARAEYYAIYASNVKHSVKANFGGCVVTHDKVNYNLICDMLDKSLEGQKISVAINVETREGVIMKLWENNWADNRTPDKDSVYFVGIGTDAWIRNVADLDRREVTTTTRKKLTKQMNAETVLLAGGKIKVCNKIEAARFAKLQEPDAYQILSDYEDAIELPAEIISEEAFGEAGADEMDNLINSFL